MSSSSFKPPSLPPPNPPTHPTHPPQCNHEDPRLLNNEIPPPLTPCYCPACAHVRITPSLLIPDRSKQHLIIMQVGLPPTHPPPFLLSRYTFVSPLIHLSTHLFTHQPTHPFYINRVPPAAAKAPLPAKSQRERLQVITHPPTHPPITNQPTHPPTHPPTHSGTVICSTDTYSLTYDGRYVWSTSPSTHPPTYPLSISNLHPPTHPPTHLKQQLRLVSGPSRGKPCQESRTRPRLSGRRKECDCR